MEAEAGVASARAQVEQATREVESAASLAKSDATATAALARARAAERDAGARLQQARAVLEQAERDLARDQRLHSEGVVPRAELERAETGVSTARQTVVQAQAQVEVGNQQGLLEATRESELQRRRTELQVAEQSLKAALARQSLVQAGARDELIAQQQAECDAARAAVQAARDAGRARIAAVVSNPAGERIRVAQRRDEEAKHAREAILAQLRSAEVKARFAGVVTDIVKRPGDAISPGQPVMLLAEMQWPEIRLEIDERDIAHIEQGQRATITADAYPDRPFSAHVHHIGPRAVAERGIMDAVLRPDDEIPWLRSGMTVDASIVIAKRAQLLVVPSESIILEGDAAYVLAVEDGVVRRREVEIGTASIEGTVILSGTDEGSVIVLRPGEVETESRVRLVEKPASVEGSGAI